MNFRRQVIEQLEAHGYKRLPNRGKGSHEVWKRDDGHTQTVPRNIDDRHFANNIMKQADVPHRFK